MPRSLNIVTLSIALAMFASGCGTTAADRLALYDRLADRAQQVSATAEARVPELEQAVADTDALLSLVSPDDEQRADLIAKRDTLLEAIGEARAVKELADAEVAKFR